MEKWFCVLESFSFAFILTKGFPVESLEVTRNTRLKSVFKIGAPNEELLTKLENAPSIKYCESASCPHSNSSCFFLLFASSLASKSVLPFLIDLL